MANKRFFELLESQQVNNISFSAKIFAPFFLAAAVLYVPGYKLQRWSIPVCAVFSSMALFLSDRILGIPLLNQTQVSAIIVTIIYFVLALVQPPHKTHAIVPIVALCSASLLSYFILFLHALAGNLFAPRMETLGLGIIINRIALVTVFIITSIFTHYFPTWCFIIGSATMSAFLVTFSLIMTVIASGQTSAVMLYSRLCISVPVIFCAVFAITVCFQKFIWHQDEVTITREKYIDE